MSSETGPVAVDPTLRHGNPGCPGTFSVDQAGPKLTEICLPLPPECWDYYT
ncbi:C-_U-editing enzyme APOBEC-1 isoform b [Mus musculus]|nr:C->U-editing enzyme APOBEC-1 isoform b [Mus musculus]